MISVQMNGNIYFRELHSQRVSTDDELMTCVVAFADEQFLKFEVLHIKLVIVSLTMSYTYALDSAL